MQAHEGFDHRVRQTLIHGEALAAPVAGRAESTHLPGNGVARLLFPFPDFFDEFFAAE